MGGGQEVLWAEMPKESERRKHRFTIRGLPADKRYSQAVPDFLSTTEVGRLVLAEDDAENEASEWELRDRREREEERRDYIPLFLPAASADGG